MTNDDDNYSDDPRACEASSNDDADDVHNGADEADNVDGLESF